jgi:hypothetical protein
MKDLCSGLGPENLRTIPKPVEHRHPTPKREIVIALATARLPEIVKVRSYFRVNFDRWVEDGAIGFLDEVPDFEASERDEGKAGAAASSRVFSRKGLERHTPGNRFGTGVPRLPIFTRVPSNRHL